MSELRIAHTAELDAETLSTAQALLVDSFDGDFPDEDWEHSLGGMHALVWEGSELIGHASVIQRRLLHDGRALRTGYVEGVGVRSDRRRQGYAGAMMTALERVIRDAYELGALSASEDAAGLYASRGWQLWQGRPRPWVPRESSPPPTTTAVSTSCRARYNSTWPPS